MAIQLNTEYIGRLENIIFYKRLGQYLIRTVPKQAINSIISASAFGRAASMARILRTLLAPIIKNPKDKNMQNRLTAAIRHFLAEAEKYEVNDPQRNHLAGFRFTADSILSQCLLFHLEITEKPGRKISLRVPAIDPPEAIVAPPGTTKTEIRLMAAGFHPDNELSFSKLEAIEIPYTTGLRVSQEIELETGAEPGSVVVVASSLRYWHDDEEICEAGFMPVEIVAAMRL